MQKPYRCPETWWAIMMFFGVAVVFAQAVLLFSLRTRITELRREVGIAVQLAKSASERVDENESALGAFIKDHAANHADCVIGRDDVFA